MNFTFVAAALVFSSVATASVPSAWLNGPAQEALPEAAALAAEEEVAARTRSRGASWGVVETIRRVEHGGSLPATFEFTVRLRDGSTRISSSASASKWLTGDRIMLLGGAATPPVSKL